MSKKFVFLSALLLSVELIGQDLFFSEYIEGSSNNKAIEIYNPTNQTIDLRQYTVKQANNGNGWGAYSGGVDARYSLPLKGYLEPGKVLVIYNSAASTTLINKIQSSGALYIGLAYSSVANDTGKNVPSFNGDDALGLFKGDVLIDVIGVPTVDPGTGWNVAGVTNATVDHTLIRKPTVRSGNTNWSASAGTNTNDSEWIVKGMDDFSDIGFHYVPIVNLSPVAVAGEDKGCWVGDEVTLDGSKSYDPDGKITSYLWTQISGPTVTINTPNQPIITFTAPATESVLSFELKVTDDSSAVGKDTINVFVMTYLNVFISEYVEGSSNNKYLEIYNHEDFTINLKSAGFEIKTAFNGSNNFTASFSDWGTTNIPAKGVVVLANSGASLYTGEVIKLPSTNMTISFNGNDAVALFRRGLLIDIVGYPDRIDTVIADMTLRRKPTVSRGSLNFKPDEWNVYPNDDVSGLGTHNCNPNAPTISNISVSPEFIYSSDEITISATLTAVTGNIASAKIIYGTGGILISQSEMWKESGDLWMGNIQPQPGNFKLEFKIVATDDQGNVAESAVNSLLIAATKPDLISSIHANLNNIVGSIVTVKGIVTIGSGVLTSGNTSAYIQDASGRGLNLYLPTYISDIKRGDELVVVGYVTLYYSTVEVTNFKYKKLSEGNTIPEAPSITIAEANNSMWEGTLLKINGVIKRKIETGTTAKAWNLTVVYNADSIIVRIPNTTGINVGSLTEGSAYWFRGVGTKFQEQYQVLVGYQEDIWPALAIGQDVTKAYKFQLNNPYPNPFNNTTVIQWELDRPCQYELAVYNILGQRLTVIRQGFGNSGMYKVVWEAKDLPSGIYFLNLIAGDRKITRKIVLMK